MSAQISLYPLGQEDLSPVIEAVWDALREHGLAFEAGAMSTITWGTDEEVFAALRDAFARAAEWGHAVMVITVSNACPVAGRGDA